jgi:hypothetical protein
MLLLPDGMIAPLGYFYDPHGMDVIVAGGAAYVKPDGD